MEVLVDTTGFPVDDELLREAVRRAAATSDAAPLEISLTLLGDDRIRALNARWLGHDRPTDVLSFALGEAPGLVGDVYVGFEQARRQAEEHGVPLEEELARLAIHGTLHLLGHDHPDGEERSGSAMFDLQERLVADLLRDRSPPTPPA